MYVSDVTDLWHLKYCTTPESPVTDTFMACWSKKYSFPTLFPRRVTSDNHSSALIRDAGKWQCMHLTGLTPMKKIERKHIPILRGTVGRGIFSGFSLWMSEIIKNILLGEVFIVIHLTNRVCNAMF